MPWISLSMVLWSVGSSRISVWILSTAWSTVVWSLPPKARPTSARGGVGEVARQIHGDLTGKGHRLGAILGFEVGELHPEAVTDLPLNLFDRDDLFFLAPEIGED